VTPLFTCCGEYATKGTGLVRQKRAQWSHDMNRQRKREVG
jgi:hypothetical protein